MRKSVLNYIETSTVQKYKIVDVSVVGLLNYSLVYMAGMGDTCHLLPSYNCNAVETSENLFGTMNQVYEKFWLK